ncbi:MAG: amidohydrolase family protein [Patulibacter sp.]
MTTQPLIITGARVFDASATTAETDRAVVIEDGRIRDTIPVGEIPAESAHRRIDVPGGTVLPGLIDMHVHLCDWSAPPSVVRDPARLSAYAAGSARQLQQAGITTVRDVGSPWGIGVAIRDAVASGRLPGCRVVASGRLICMTGGHGSELGHVPTWSREADGVDACRQAVREQVKEGNDWVKVALDGARSVPGKVVIEFTQPELDAIVDEAHRLGVRVACHTFQPETMEMAIRAGVDTVEHGLSMSQENVEQLAAAGIVLVPTIRLPIHILDNAEAVAASSEYGVFAVRHATEAKPTHAASFQRALKAGVRVAAGTDTSSFVGGLDSLVHDLDYMVELGMSPAEAVLSATQVAAETLERDGQLGSLVSGALADVLVCEGDPLKDVRALHEVRLVVQGGEVVVDRVAEAARPS